MRSDRVCSKSEHRPTQSRVLPFSAPEETQFTMGRNGRTRSRCAPVWAWCIATCVAMCVPPLARAGELTRSGIEALFPPPLVVGEKGADLPVWPVYRRAGAALELQAQVFETVDLEPVAGYGGKPTNLMVVMDRDGSFRDVRLLSHAEPIFKSEKGTATLAAFAAQYQGLTLNHDIQVLGPRAQRVQTETTATLHGVLAGTVSALAIDRTILESAAQVAQARVREGKAAPAPRGPNDRYRKSGWNALAAAQLVQPWKLTNRAVETAFRDQASAERGQPGAGRDAEGLIRPQVAAVDAWIGLASLPQLGRNLLDPVGWMDVRAAREDGTPVLVALDGGRYPLRAAPSPDAARGAVLGVRQDGKVFPLRDFRYTQGLALSGQRSGVAPDAAARFFAIDPAADGTRFDLARPMQLTLAVQRRVGDAPDALASVSFERRFEIPNVAELLPQRETPAWMAAWSQRGADLAVLGAGLVLLTLALARQQWLTATPRRLAAFRTAALVFTLGFVGWWAQGQLTIVTWTSAIEALVAHRALDFLLADPLAVVLWAFTLVTLFVWGRGSFCGWLCPFGALQELAAKAARIVGLRQRHLRPAWDTRLKRVKYAVLTLLLGAAAVSPLWTERLVEVEPFKTSISLYFQREWPYVLWAVLCIAAGLLFYRGYCRWLCPLGAGLAVLGRVRLWAWIPRRAECGTPCQTCRHRCDYQAIDTAGRVDYAECFQCQDCVAIHQDDHRCLPLVRARRHRVIPIVAAEATA
jgi:NosR/NirI family nitrous oxide reductase transcriptional regulator